ncbi:MAG: Asp-tRNA(Asn)/Glu-tRNA(Gln) amidotransferase subunit GatC [Myxococcales bacterium]|nr:Asp-tRNA(Asn)/Glu-tRNA(Gln) amidotransferase subunit GatC [Myxococcales bacterium]
MGSGRSRNSASSSLIGARGYHRPTGRAPRSGRAPPPDLIVSAVTRISAEQVKHVASLARLTYSEEETARLAADLEAILDYVETLGEVNTEGVRPMEHVLPLETPLREDRAVAAMAPDRAVANAPVAKGFAFVVPKVIDGEEEG